MNAVFWLILIIGLVVLEIVTLGLTSIWFAGGALAGFILSMLDVRPVFQWAAFCVVSLILLFCTRPWALRYFNSQKKVRTNVDSLIGKTAVVTSEVSNPEGQGEAVVNGLTWTARSADDSVKIPEGTHVEITEVQGVKLIVKIKKEG